MQSEIVSGLPLEHFSRSRMGLWVKGCRSMEEIQLLWQPRTVVQGSRVQTLDANGSVLRDEHVSEVRWGDAWNVAGVIPMDEAFAEWSGAHAFDACSYGVMRHMVDLCAAGYGETPEEVVSWFRDLGRLEWLIDGALYRVVSGSSPFDGLRGAIGMVRGEDENLFFDIVVGEGTYSVSLDSHDLHVAMLTKVFLAEHAAR